MDVEYTWIFRQGKNYLQFRFLYFNGLFVYPIGVEEIVIIIILARKKVYFIRVHDNLM